MWQSFLLYAFMAFVSLVLAAPTNTAADWLSLVEKREASSSSHVKRDLDLRFSSSVCDMNAPSLPPAPTALPPPSPGLTLKHIAVGRGTQNYSCTGVDESQAPKAVGAVASLFNTTCMAATSNKLHSDIPSIALGYAIPTSSDPESPAVKLLSGHHYFTNLTTPFFDLNVGPRRYGAGAVAKLAASDAPANAPKGTNGLGSVPWLKLIHVDGSFQEIYRVETAGGVAPKTCKGQPEKFQVEYAAAYWFYAQ